jgi:hypothetical protein
MSMDGESLPATRRIVVQRGGREIDVTEADLFRLPDGRAGARWGGLVFPLLEEDRIETADIGVAPARCTRWHEASPEWRYEPGPPGFDGYLFVGGDAHQLKTATANLRRAGVRVVRTGPNLSGSPGDWFIRVAGLDDATPARLAAILGEAVARPASATDGSLRERLLVDALEATAAARDALRADLERALAAAAAARSRAEADAGLVDRLNEMAQRLATADAENLTLRSRISAAPRPVQAPKSLRTEIESVIENLLPRLDLLWNSVEFMAVELKDRSSIWRVLGALDRQDRGQPTGWKSVAGRQGWWERHFSTGQDDQGRVYARHEDAQRPWKVLVSHKQDQTGDIRRLG